MDALHEALLGIVKVPRHYMLQDLYKSCLRKHLTLRDAALQLTQLVGQVLTLVTKLLVLCKLVRHLLIQLLRRPTLVLQVLVQRSDLALQSGSLELHQAALLLEVLACLLLLVHK